ncbi:hypothetical protein KVM21_04850 [Helicobacter pylori]|nr:hypothetical protein KVM21_04850 [Helicobacter pylori]
MLKTRMSIISNLNAIDTMYRNYNDEVKQAKFSNQELPLPFDLKEFVNAIGELPNR